MDIIIRMHVHLKIKEKKTIDENLESEYTKEQAEFQTKLNLQAKYLSQNKTFIHPYFCCMVQVRSAWCHAICHASTIPKMQHYQIIIII